MKEYLDNQKGTTDTSHIGTHTFGNSSYDNNITNDSKSQIAPLPSQYNMQQDNKNIQNNEDIAPIKENKELPKNPTTEEAYEKKATRSEIQNELIKDMGITIEDLEKGKDIIAIGYQRTDPIRLNEKVFGVEIGNKINDATIRKKTIMKLKELDF